MISSLMLWYLCDNINWCWLIKVNCVVKMKNLMAYLKRLGYQTVLYRSALVCIITFNIYLIATFRQPIKKAKRVETSGYDGYDDDWTYLYLNYIILRIFILFTYIGSGIKGVIC